MRKLFIKARDYLDDGLRGMCGRLTPGKRVAAIVGMVVVFAGVNFYMLFRAVYNIGREDARREKVIEITPLSVPDIVPHGTDTLSGGHSGKWKSSLTNLISISDDTGSK